eukprot:2821579-Prymnesium_polylepis.1
MAFLATDGSIVLRWAVITRPYALPARSTPHVWPTIEDTFTAVRQKNLWASSASFRAPIGCSAIIDNQKVVGLPQSLRREISSTRS